METSLSTLPFPPSLEGILRCWLSAVQSVEKAFLTSPQLTGPPVSMQTTALGQVGSNLLQPSTYQVQGVAPTASPANISMGSLTPLPTAAVATAGGGYPALSASAAAANGSFPTLSESTAQAVGGFPTLSTANSTAGGSLSSLGASTATAGSMYTSSGIPLGRPRALQKQLSTGTQHNQLHSMMGFMQNPPSAMGGLPSRPPIALAAGNTIDGGLPSRPPSVVFPAAAPSNSMGSIASLVSAGLLPQSSGVMTQALPQGSLGHLAALLDLPHGSTSSAIMMQTSLPR